MVSKVRGQFTDFTADIVTAEDPLPSTVPPSCSWPRSTPATSGRDEHLRTNDFFDIENHPTMTFTSTGLEGSGSDYKLARRPDDQGRHQAGHVRPRVRRRRQGPVGQHQGRLHRLDGTINRKDFGLTYNAALETGGVMIGDKVTIELDIEAALRAEPEASP